MAWWKRGDSVGQPEPRKTGIGQPSGSPTMIVGLVNPGVHNRLTVMHEPHGADRRPGWRDVQRRQWGANAVVKFGQLVMSPQTSRLQIQELGPRSLCFTNVSKDMGQEMINRPALEGPRYRFTAVNDAAVIAQARQRAQARGKVGVKL